MGIIKTGKIQSHGDVVGLQTRIAALEDKYVKALWYAEISSGASGTITPPTGGTIVLNEWGNDVDAVISTIVTGKKPDFISAKTSVGAIVTATLAANGAWTISGTPSAYPIALVYVYETKLVNFDRASSLYDEEFGQAVNPTDSPTFVGLTLSGLTASLPVVIDAAKALVSLAYTGATSFRKNLGLETEDGPTFDHLHLTTDLPVSEGGTGVSTFALNGILFGNAASAIGVTAIGAEGQFLRVGANPFVPAWSTLTLPNAGTAYRLPVFSATNVMTELAAVGATGEYLKGNNGAIPSWATLNQAAVAGLTTSDSPTFNQGNFTTLHTTTILADHIGEHVGAHTVVFDNTITLPASTIVPDAGTIGLGSGKGLIQFDDETTDFISFMNCNVGIGTSPTTKLDILDSTITPLYVRNAAVATYSLIRFYNGGTAALGSMGYDSTGAQFLNDIQSAINMTILNGGNVGIGTTTPGALLHVAGNIRLSGNLLDTNGNIIFAPEERAGAVNYLTVRSGETGVGTGIFAIGADTNISLNLRGKGTGGVWIDDTFANSFEFHGSAASGATMKTTAGDLILKSASVEGLRIQSTTGNVGIGTTAPLRRLDINEASGNCLRLIYNDTDGSAANYADFLMGSAGDLTITSPAAHTTYFSPTVYDDLQFQVSYAKVPAANYPTWEAFTTNTSEYAFSVDDYIDTAVNELPHCWKQGTAGHAHIHITTKAVPAEEQKAQFTVTFAYADTNEVWVEAPLTAELTIPISTTALTNFYLDLGNLTLTNYLIGTQIRCRIKRVAKSAGGTEYVGDIFITQVGIHLEKDTLGSRQELIK